ncbi:hypothetical protein C0989_007942 [Termitomyces sp. Mn162]|nr:hypothetical protein C0989_007942 [Termitomyces sp. Mn162]
MPAPPQPTVAATALAQPASAFVLPIMGAGIHGASPSPVSLSLPTQFLNVNVAVIMAIIMHDFRVADLHKLDPSNYNKEIAYMFNSSTNQFEVSYRAAKEYKTPFSVLIPLQIYFNILMFHTNNPLATGAFFRYTAHLLKLVAEYKWSTVFDYHSISFNHRHADMAVNHFFLQCLANDY